VRAYIHEVKASISAMRPGHYDKQEKETSSEVLVNKPCPSPRGSDNVGSAKGSVTQGESMVKGIHANKNSTAEICAEAACFPSSHAEESGSRTSGVEGVVVTVGAMMDGDGAERVVRASYDK
jgi:hypothetical protein